LILLALLVAAVVFVSVTGKKVPVLQHTRSAMLVVLVLGMAMCTSGIGRVAAAQQWTHPLAILGYLLGAAILLVGLATIFGWQLPFIQSDTQAMLVVAVLIAIKVVNTLVHSFFTSGVR
jgi:hypothetical protein